MRTGRRARLVCCIAADLLAATFVARPRHFRPGSLFSDSVRGNLVRASIGLRKSGRAVRSYPNEVGILVCLGGRREQRAEVAKGAELAGHHALEICSHLWVVRDISPGDLLLVVSRGAAMLLLIVMITLRRASSVAVIVVVEGKSYVLRGRRV